MVRAVVLSFLLHGFLISALIWSTQISLLLLKANQKKIESLGIVQVDLLYKPTESAMRKGETKQDLPPPQVKTKTANEPEPSPITTKTPPKKQSPKKESPKQDFRALFDKIRQETGEELRRAPRDDNFPTREDGEEKARGTGGSSLRALSPAQLALQSAMRKHFELPLREKFSKQHPNAKGFMNVRLVGVGNGFELVSLQVTQSSGFNVLDRSCELAVRKAIQQESFAPDVVEELSGKETVIICQP